MSKPYPYCLYNLNITLVDDLKFPTQDFGMLYGYGVFETLRITKGKPILLQDHIDRMAYGTEILEIPFPFSYSQIQEAVSQLVYKNNMPESLLNLYVTPGDRTVGETKMTFSTPLFLAFQRPLPTPIPEQGISLALREESFKRNRIDQLKTMSYIRNIFEKRFAEPYDDVLLYNSDHEILETPVCNVFFVKDGQITTPKSPDIMVGITRSFLINNQPYFGYPITEKALSLEDITEADEIFLSSSVRGIITIDMVEGIPGLSSGPISHEIQIKYNRYIESFL